MLRAKSTEMAKSMKFQRVVVRDIGTVDPLRGRRLQAVSCCAGGGSEH